MLNETKYNKACYICILNLRFIHCTKFKFKKTVRTFFLEYSKQYTFSVN